LLIYIKKKKNKKRKEKEEKTKIIHRKNLPTKWLK